MGDVKENLLMAYLDTKTHPVNPLAVRYIATRQGFEPLSTNAHGQSALFYAIRQANVEVLRMLCTEFGFDVNVKDKSLCLMQYHLLVNNWVKLKSPDVFNEVTGFLLSQEIELDLIISRRNLYKDIVA